MRTVSAPQEGDYQLVILGSGSLESGVALDAGPVGFYRVDVSAPDVPATYFTSVPVSDQFIHLDVEVVDDSSVRMTLTSLSSDGATNSLVVHDDIPITNLTLTNSGVGYLPDAELYFNNTQITPEPTGLVFCAGALAATILRRRQRTGI